MKVTTVVGIVVAVFVALVLYFLIVYNVCIGISCYKEFTYTGHLDAIKNPYHLVIDGEDWFVSDWFYPDGRMPLYVYEFVNHTVWFRYVSGCGRIMVLDIKLAEE